MVINTIKEGLSLDKISYQSKMARINEDLKKSFVTDVPNQKISNDPDLGISIKTLTNDPFAGSLVVNSANELEDYGYYYGSDLDKWEYQNTIIRSYRKIASDPEVSNAINIITSEMAWTADDDVFKIDIEEENEKISDLINTKFTKIISLLNIRENIFAIARQMYIDGQMNVSLAYRDGKMKEGIQESKILEPINLYFDGADKRWKYQEIDQSTTLYSTDILAKRNTFTEQEMVHVDFGLQAKIDQGTNPFMVNLGYLENVAKSVNTLKTLENMLIPLRYSRSVSRRLFNIDVADLPPKQAKELMDKIRAEFRYKKSFDVDNWNHYQYQKYSANGGGLLDVKSFRFKRNNRRHNGRKGCIDGYGRYQTPSKEALHFNAHPRRIQPLQ